MPFTIFFINVRTGDDLTATAGDPDRPFATFSGILRYCHTHEIITAHLKEYRDGGWHTVGGE
jgi:hypothetical protein